jgi:hypothetical protein
MFIINNGDLGGAYLDSNIVAALLKLERCLTN